MSTEPELPHMLPKWFDCPAAWDDVEGNVIELRWYGLTRTGSRVLVNL